MLNFSNPTQKSEITSRFIYIIYIIVEAEENKSWLKLLTVSTTDHFRE